MMNEKDIDAFIADLQKVCDKHNLYLWADIEHEHIRIDTQPILYIAEPIELVDSETGYIMY